METVLSRLFDTYEIKCYKLTWNSSTDVKDVNIFSGVNPDTTEEIDFKDYLIDMGSINYDFDEAEKENGENQLYFVSSDLTFKLSGIENNDYLKTYFGLYTNTDYIKWRVRITNGTTIIWEGLINHESIELSQSPDDDSDQISVTALSYEKEFKNYYQNTPLPTPDEIFGSAYNVIGGMGEGNTRKVKWFQYVLGDLFPNTSWSLEDGIDDWYIIQDPVLRPKTETFGTSDNYVFIKSSYERIYTNGENCYDFLRRLCNAMGWVFYYYDGQFYIKNRASNVPTLTDLDVDSILDVSVSKYKETNTFQHILIIDGVIDGGDNTGGNRGGSGFEAYQMRGARFQLISDYNSPRLTNGLWWYAINGYSLLDLPEGEQLIRYHNETENNFNIAVHTKGNGSPLWNWYIYGIDAKEILRIDHGDTGNEYWLYDVTNGYNSAHTKDAQSPAPINQWNENRVRFKGNYGNCLVKIETIGTSTYPVYTYQDYVQENQFVDNWLKFFESKTTRKINLKYDEVITNPIQVFQFINDTDSLYTGEWVINNMKIDILDETTSFELQRKLEVGDRR